MLTRLEVFRVSRGIKMADLVDESGYHRSHVFRIRQARIEPGRDAIAAIVSALRRLSLEDVRAETVFELTREESGPWRKERTQTLSRELAAYQRERDKTQRVLQMLPRHSPARWLEIARRAASGMPAVVARAATLQGRRFLDRDPAAAAPLFELAAALADESAEVTPDYRAFLSGLARLEWANALRQLGAYRDALPLLQAAEQRFEGIPMCTHELGRAWFAHGSVLFKMNGLDEALHYLRLAVNILAALDDQRRLARVRLVEGNVLFERNQAEAARALWLSILPVFEAGRDRHSLGSLLLNLGWCDLERGDPEKARGWLARALERFGKLGSRTDMARTRWAFALCEARYGDRENGIEKLRRERNEFKNAQLFTEAGMVDLDIAEILLLDPANAAEAARVCADIVPIFQRAGARKESLRVLAHLWEAANTRTATPELVRQTRTEVKRAEREGEYRSESEATQ